MSSDGQLIVCRRCKEVIPQEEGSCPHCGTSIRGDIAYIAAIVFGLIMASVTVFSPGQLFIFGVLGLAIAGTSGYLFYNKRQRIQQADQSGESAV
jgi:uncharacterized paraquat-inducible protein A